ncbi:MAG: DUF3488 and DUF4129 domain-containing transglutaminase family protein [Anaerolineales bacterium]
MALYAVSMNLNETPWLTDSSLHGSALTLGIIFGFLLAKSRFRSRTAWLYSLILSVFISLQLTSRFIPSSDIFLSSAAEAPIQLMHVRLLSFIDLLMSWIRSYSLGELIRVQQIRQFLLLFLVFNCTLWFGWWIFRKQRVLIGAAPMGLLVAININRSNLTMAYLQLYLLCIMLVLVLIHFKLLHHSWGNRKVDHPDGLGLEWGTSAAMISVIAILFAGIAPLVATPEGWDTIREWFQAEEPISRNLLQSDDGSIDGPPSLSADQTPELSEIGAPPSSGLDTVMWVEISDSAPPPESIDAPATHRQHYWRSHIFTNYTGRGWEPLEDPVVYSPEDKVVEPSMGRYILHQTYHLENPDTDPLFGVNLLYSVTLDDQMNHIVQAGLLHPLSPNNSPYSVTSWAASPTELELASARETIPPEIMETYLQLPLGIPTRIFNLAERITQGLESPYEKALQIESYLRLNYPYNLDVPPPAEGKDIVEYFLYESEGGFCSYYATAMVVMLRSIDIPSRVVSGFAMGNFDHDLGAYRVRERDAHAWVEVYFPEIGWVEFEPTANRATFQRQDGGLAGSIDEIEGDMTRWTLSPSLLPAFLGVLLLGFLLVALVLLFKFNFEQKQSNSLYGRIGEIYLSMRHLLAGVGFRGTASMTPHEFLTQLNTQLSDQTVILRNLQDATDDYSRIRYSETKPSSEDERSLDEMWKQNRSVWFRFVLHKRAIAAFGSIRSKFF